MTNIVTKPMAKSIGALSSIAPPHIVAIQLKILIPLGTAIASVITMNGRRAEIEMPVVNMWWTQTPKERNPIATVDRAIALYPKIGLWLIRGMTSEKIPIAGGIMMYTAGWEENQNRCCHMIGSPPTAGERNAVIPCRARGRVNSPAAGAGVARRARPCGARGGHT